MNKPPKWVFDYISDLKGFKKEMVHSYLKLSKKKKYHAIFLTQKGVVIGINEALKLLSNYVKLPNDYAN